MLLFDGSDKNLFKDLIKKQLTNIKPKAKQVALQILLELVRQGRNRDLGNLQGLNEQIEKLLLDKSCRNFAL